MRVAMSHAQMNRTDCCVLAHGQADSNSSVYGECRDTEHAKHEKCGHGELVFMTNNFQNIQKFCEICKKTFKINQFYDIIAIIYLS